MSSNPGTLRFFPAQISALPPMANRTAQILAQMFTFGIPQAASRRPCLDH